ncbi:hypothetical protein KIPE111705_11300 [Kibdelosporangium persicum]|uniref:hypothetical protein n=1 Tax=Kibdelosporangium persicum TaxID=2698649 RepID=UPI0015675D96|nr:hypothetical protein [Kibdelosporangium persicum]
MTTISAADLTSELVDLTEVPLRELRTITTRQLAEAVEWEVEFSTANGDERQVQNE